MMNDEEKTGRAEKRRREEEKKNRGQGSGVGGQEMGSAEGDSEKLNNPLQNKMIKYKISEP